MLLTNKKNSINYTLINYIRIITNYYTYSVISKGIKYIVTAVEIFYNNILQVILLRSIKPECSVIKLF